MEIYNPDISENKNTEIDKVKDTKCINCAGIMKLDTPSGSMVCPYCGYSVKIAYSDVEVIEEETFRKQMKRDNQNFEKRVIICRSCGAQSFMDSSKIISTCEFCGSDQLIQKNEDALKPDGIVPFKIGQEELENYLKKWMDKKKLCSFSFKKKFKISDVHGAYIPCWSFDAKTRSIYWNGLTYGERIDDFLFPAVTEFNAEKLKKIEPYYTEENKKFKSQYLTGYDSQYYNIGLRDAWAMAVNDIKERLMNDIIKDEKRRKNIVSKKILKGIRTEFSGVTYKYLLLPIWYIDIDYKNKHYCFLMNGQTGKTVGKVPISIVKCIFCIVLGIGLLLLLYFLLPFLFSLINEKNVVIVIFIIMIISIMIVRFKMM